MLTVSYREAGQTENKVITAQSISWNDTTRDFVLYDRDGSVICAMKPHYLHVKAVVTAPDN